MPYEASVYHDKKREEDGQKVAKVVRHEVPVRRLQALRSIRPPLHYFGPFRALFKAFQWERKILWHTVPL